VTTLTTVSLHSAFRRAFRFVSYSSAVISPLSKASLRTLILPEKSRLPLATGTDCSGGVCGDGLADDGAVIWDKEPRIWTFDSSMPISASENACLLGGGQKYPRLEFSQPAPERPIANWKQS
jgi:hypothetical protein